MLLEPRATRTEPGSAAASVAQVSEWPDSPIGLRSLHQDVDSEMCGEDELASLRLPSRWERRGRGVLGPYEGALWYFHALLEESEDAVMVFAVVPGSI